MKLKLIISIVAIIIAVALMAVFFTGDKEVTGAAQEGITGAGAACEPECDFNMQCEDEGFYSCTGECKTKELVTSCSSACESSSKCSKIDGFLETRNVLELETLHGTMTEGDVFYSALVEGSVGVVYECLVVKVNEGIALTSCTKT